MPGRMVKGGILAGVIASSACSSTAPPGWRHSLEEMQRSTMGSWTTVHLGDPEAGTSRGGELLAVYETNLFLATTGGIVDVPRRCLTQVTIAAYRGDVSTAVAWGVTGGVSTLSHGIGLVVSLPVWATTTALAGIAQHGTGEKVFARDGNDVPLAGANAFARFPQGLPPGFLDRHPPIEDVLDKSCR